MEYLGKIIQNSDFFIIAEIGLNHNGSFGNGLKLIEEAKKAGANAVKFQLHISDKERMKNAPTPEYFANESRDEYFDRTAFSLKEWKKLTDYAHKKNLFFIVSPFSHEAVDILEQVGIDGYKIASGETTNIPLLEYINSKQKPVLLSTGMSDWKEISKAVDALENNLIVLFQCTSQYPCFPQNLGLNIITEMKEKYGNLIIGFSDHTPDYSASISAYMMGARVFEKHYTLSKKVYGPDAHLSLEPQELNEYVKGLSFISEALKNPVNKDDIDKFKQAKLKYEKSIVASRNLIEGHIIEYQDLEFKKPGDGLRADQYKEVIGNALNIDVEEDERITFEKLRNK